MPRVRRQPKARRDWTEHHREQLRSGHDFLGEAFGKDRPDFAAMKQAWDELRDEILPAWIAEHPGTRPYAWWVFDAPEPRRNRTDGQHPFDNPARLAFIERVARAPEAHADYKANACRLSFGVPSVLAEGEGFNDFECEYESEAEYLARFGLLSYDECEALDAE